MECAKEWKEIKQNDTTVHWRNEKEIDRVAKKKKDTFPIEIYTVYRCSCIVVAFKRIELNTFSFDFTFSYYANRIIFDCYRILWCLRFIFHFDFIFFSRPMNINVLTHTNIKRKRVRKTEMNHIHFPYLKIESKPFP